MASRDYSTIPGLLHGFSDDVSYGRNYSSKASEPFNEDPIPVYIYIYIYIHTCTLCECVYVYMHIHIYIYKHTYLHTI